MRVREVGLLLGLSLCLLTGAMGQAKKDDEVIKIDTQLVDVPFTATAPAGTLLKGIKLSDITIYEDGKKQEVVDFSTTTAPFEVVLILDTSGSARNDLLLIKQAAKDFVSSLRPGDRVAVIAFRTERTNNQAFAVPEVLSPLTDDRAKLAAALDGVKTSNGTPYYDALQQVAEKIFSQRPAEEFRGRRALVALTDGVDSSSAADFKFVKEQLGQVGVISFFVKVDTRDFFEEALLGDCRSSVRFSAAQIRRYYQTINSKGSRMEKATNFCQLGDFERLAVSKRLYDIANEEMNELAKGSGGRVFPVGDMTEARNAFKSVSEEIGTKYTLGYYPSNEKRDGTYRKIKVEIKGVPAGTVVRSREGYTAPSN